MISEQPTAARMIAKGFLCLCFFVTLCFVCPVTLDPFFFEDKCNQRNDKCKQRNCTIVLDRPTHECFQVQYKPPKREGAQGDELVIVELLRRIAHFMARNPVTSTSTATGDAGDAFF